MKHPVRMVLRHQIDEKAIAEAKELLARGTDHLPVTQVEAVSDEKGSKLCSIGSYTHPVSPGVRLKEE